MNTHEHIAAMHQRVRKTSKWLTRIKNRPAWTIFLQVGTSPQTSDAALGRERRRPYNRLISAGAHDRERRAPGLGGRRRSDAAPDPYHRQDEQDGAVLAKLRPLASDRMPLHAPPPKNTRGKPLVLSRVHWVRPKLVAEVTY